MPAVATVRLVTASLLIGGLFVLCETADGMPAFAREYGVSCNVCHAAYPRLNDFGQRFAGNMNYRMANWRDHTVPAGDDMLALPKTLPLAARAQAFVQARDAESIDPVTGDAPIRMSGYSPDLVRALIEAGAEMDRIQSSGVTALVDFVNGGGSLVTGDGF